MKNQDYRRLRDLWQPPPADDKSYARTPKQIGAESVKLIKEIGRVLRLKQERPKKGR